MVDMPSPNCSSVGHCPLPANTRELTTINKLSPRDGLVEQHDGAAAGGSVALTEPVHSLARIDGVEDEAKLVLAN